MAPKILIPIVRSSNIRLTMNGTSGDRMQKCTLSNGSVSCELSFEEDMKSIDCAYTLPMPSSPRKHWRLSAARLLSMTHGVFEPLNETQEVSSTADMVAALEACAAAVGQTIEIFNATEALFNSLRQRWLKQNKSIGNVSNYFKVCVQRDFAFLTSDFGFQVNVPESAEFSTQQWDWAMLQNDFFGPEDRVEYDGRGKRVTIRLLANWIPVAMMVERKLAGIPYSTRRYVARSLAREQFMTRVRYGTQEVIANNDDIRALVEAYAVYVRGTMDKRSMGSTLEATSELIVQRGELYPFF